MIDSRGRDSGSFPEEGKGMRGCEAGTHFCGERQFRIPLQTTQAAPEDGDEVPYLMMTGKIPPFASDRGGVFFSAVLSVIDELPHLSFQLGTQDLHNSESPRMR